MLWAFLRFHSYFQWHRKGVVFTNKWQNIPPSSVYERHAVMVGYVEDNDRSDELEGSMKAQIC